MIAHLSGRLTSMREDRVVIECAGVGYQVMVAPAALASLPEVGQAVQMPTYLSVREDAMVLYGFAADDEKALFEELLTVNGVGPKVAQNLVASIPPAQLVEAIAHGDEARLTGISGVGKKLAQRVIVELSDKVGQRGWRVSLPATGGVAASEVIEALTGLGFTATEARRAARLAVQATGDGAAIEDVIKAALRQVSER